MMNSTRLNLCFVSSLILLSACQALQPNAGPTAAKKALQPAVAEPTPVLAIPMAVTQDLLARPPVAIANNEPRFNVSAVDVALSDFFHSVVHDTPYSLVVHPSISGTISLQLKQVTLAETLAIVQSLYGFDIRRQGMVYQVYPAGLRTEIIAVNYLMLQRNGFSSISVNSGGVSQDNNNQNGNNQGGQNLANNSLQNDPFANNNNGQAQNSQQQFNGSTIQSESRTDFWSDLKEAVEGVLGEGPQRMVVVSKQAGLVTVRGMPDEIAAVKAFLGQSEQHLQRQVVLEAKIIEVTLSDEYQQGINWQNALATIGSTSFNFTTSGVIPNNTISSNVGGVSAISFSNADFNGVINLLETQGNAQVLSSPRVTAMNNQKAVIKVGQDEYFVTDITSNTTIAGTGATTTSPNISLQPFFSGIALDVTPQIDQNGSVILHVHPSVTETSEQSKTIRFSDEQIVLPLAQSNIRESDTIIKAQSGEIVVIGGLMQTVTSDSESRTPVLGAIPILGQLFTSKNKVERKKELVILLKPTVVGNGVWQQQLQQSAELITDWYPEQ
ncbi:MULTISPECIES: pilus (MSHA type) biogenesis protein MshL [unclassified Arsukibacterium]|uniref:pilus (MSHA type) biogenesis protein MshL n=1 Tax=unclassified Arsukibacterium TaxID=2635278 RepID=UPI000C53D54D|nr:MULTISPECIES: pilus (MSHA type) biogenesis protein MshL [unclassified Arsukibacterium]MAA94986.1 pilus (MSHA type) biogenesis protein MshL [Rheinheimera sp.]MBM35400.1 pilus (MSHA type) biogenesis protein MshL [Rheinheimera sp.]HAW94506.1 pilus (MSHA type) biogenesis protein MshL [Candidatus Azambacteria bacterium]|tara:strand:- start:30960 stop:32621 length:1662 start_codon:yes stop_codon:yes gene_type:complete